MPDKKILKSNPRAILQSKYIADKDKFNTEVSKVKLEFNVAEDISYIIVKEDDDINKPLDFISNNFKKKLFASDLEILMTKIISTNQIINDF